MSRRNVSIYVAAWVVFMTMYAAALIVNGLPIGLSVRNAVANQLSEALLGILVLHLCSRLPWRDDRKARFFGIHVTMLVTFMVASTAGWMALVLADSLIFTGELALHIDYRIIL